MLDINNWFFVQLFNFLALLLLLNIILFKPLLRLFKEREGRTKGFLDEATATDKEKDNLLVQIETKLAGARDQAKTDYIKLTGEGSEMHKKTVGSAQKDAAEMSIKARKDIEAAAEKAKEQLKSEVEVFSKSIVEKMVGA